MKSINKTSAVIFQKLVSLLGENEHLKLDNAKDSFMYLSFEKLYDCDFGGRPAAVYSMSHYFEQEGDLIPDPDMTFIALRDNPESFYPATFQNLLSYTEALYKNDKEIWMINKSKQADITYFANIWLKNIKYQQGL
jgi:hypothetical protein